MTRQAIRLAASLAILVVARPARARAQEPAAAGMAAPITVGSEDENYLRYLQSLGLAPLYPWSVRGFSPGELDRLRPASAHPWSARPEFRRDTARGFEWTVVTPQLDVWHNSDFPFGMNDGAVWRGRGYTVAAQGGVAARWRFVSLTLDPIVFWAQNREFRLMPNGMTGPLQFQNPVFPTAVDLPQRFGNTAYSRLDPGQSTLRLDAFRVAIGISTANQWWGPMSEFPFLLGDNAAGFPHLFVGTGAPLNVGIGHLYGRLMYGQLEQSAFTDDTGRLARRFASGVVLTFTPRGVPGLELGAARFYHAPWALTRHNFLKPLTGVTTWNAAISDGGSAITGDPENQLASVFFRWVLPHHGLDVYGEFGHEDFNINMGDLLQEPDYDATYGLGLRKAWQSRDRIVALRGEVMNFQRSSIDLHRSEGSIYNHAQIRQGHTERGQLLGSGFGVGSAAASTIAVERYTPGGELRVRWMRIAPMDGIGRTPTNQPMIDVQHALTVERRVVRGGLEVGAGITGVYEFNRYFQHDARNLQLSLSLRGLGR